MQVILFTGENCAGCDLMKERFKVLKKRYKNKLKFLEVDVEKNYEDSIKYGIRSIPAVTIVDDMDRVLDMTIGSVPLASLERLIDKLIGR